MKISLPLWMQDELELTSHKAKGIHQGEHLWKEQCCCGLYKCRMNHFITWHWVCMAWLVKILRFDWKSSTSSEKLLEAPVCQEWINGAHKKVHDYVKQYSSDKGRITARLARQHRWKSNPIKALPFSARASNRREAESVLPEPVLFAKV